MMPSTITCLPRWTSSAANKWADYIELLCVQNSDHIVTIDDLIDLFVEEKADELHRGNLEHSPKFDKLVCNLQNYYELLQFRSNSLNGFYPFLVEDGKSLSLKTRIKEEHFFYYFLLFASNLSFFDCSTRYYLTHAFEDISCSVLRCMTPPNAITHVFGTSRTEEDALMYKGTLRARIGLLANNISALTSKTFDNDMKFDVPGGDGGLDIVSYLPIDNTPFIPVSFAQCACSYDEWADKQFSILPDRWKNRLDYIAPYLQFMFVPFYYRLANGEFENPTEILTCIIDRHRFYCIASSNRQPFDDFSQHSIREKVYNLVS